MTRTALATGDQPKPTPDVLTAAVAAPVDLAGQLAPAAATPHTCNGANGPHFGRRTAGCSRCDELAAGAAPRQWRPSRRPWRRDGEQRIREIREHDCVASRCGPICTFGEW